MLFQGQPITIPQQDAQGSQFSLMAMLGLGKAREKELRKQIKRHDQRCTDADGRFNIVDFLTTCPIDCQTPQELAYVAMTMEGVVQALYQQPQNTTIRITL